MHELLTACWRLWADGHAVELLVAGDLDAGNRSALGPGELQALASEQRVRCLGHVEDMRALYASVDVVVHGV
ncbi:MAG: glycosyltransferase family 4 protein [Cyanobacteria bacterium K_Offshore_0m_m2_072]|nr:glycosyltransferase family 4 protein [Cyanobacteria bacterium K_Offshore_0m_m2_072]